jgi:hypothetical protein
VPRPRVLPRKDLDSNAKSVSVERATRLHVTTSTRQALRDLAVAWYGPLQAGRKLHETTKRAAEECTTLARWGWGAGTLIEKVAELRQVLTKRMERISELECELAQARKVLPPESTAVVTPASWSPPPAEWQFCPICSLPLGNRRFGKDRRCPSGHRIGDGPERPARPLHE